MSPPPDLISLFSRDPEGNAEVAPTSASRLDGDSRTSLTDEQRRAVECRDASVVLSSGAGCGKTHVLTERYLSHLREGASVGELVAITFTDRAARQMRGRIRSAVLKELGAAAGEAVNVWEDHLRGLESAQITTIHSFCGTLLRQHAVEAGLDPHFDVLEDALASNLETESLTECLQSLLPERSPLGDDLRELVFLYAWPTTVEAVRSLMRHQDAEGWKRWLAKPPEAVAAGWQGADRERLLPAYIEHLITSVPKIAHCLTLLRKLECVGPITRANVARILQETPALAKAYDLATAVKDLTEAAKVGKERAKAWNSEADYEAVRDAFEGFRKELPERLGLFMEAAEELPEAVMVGQRFLRVAEAAAQTYRLRKRRNGVVDFQDLLTLARDLLRDNSEVREQLQRRFRFLLIDELQDTDPVQMELVTLLCGAGLTAGKLFAVGDHKQSIYRFRNADVQQFLNLRNEVPHEGRLDLTRNFRSQPAILHFVNALFLRHMKEYKGLVAYHPQVNPAPCIEFLWSTPEEKESVTESRKREADAIARRIAAMVAGSEELVRDGNRTRPVKYGDVVLLFRAMSNVHIYEAALRRLGIDYYLVGGRAFFAQQEIYDLLNLLRALENPQDTVSLVGTLRSPFCCLSDEALFLLNTHGRGLWAGLHDDATLTRIPEEERSTAERARQSLDRWCALKDSLPIARLLGEIFADSGYDAAMQFEPLGDRKLANLWKLLDLARTFDRSGIFGLADFIRRLGDLVQSQPREEQAATQPENADVVRLMTIHQSKGLEFPVVIVPDLAARPGGSHSPAAVWDASLGCVVRAPADEDPPPFSDYGRRLWKVAEDIADHQEDLRTLYVACTRAEDYLILSGSVSQPFQPQNSWMLTLSERFDLLTGACRDEAIGENERPRVRATDPASLPTGGHGKQRATLDDLPDLDPRQVAPVPACLTGEDVVPLAVLEDRWLKPSRPKAKEAIALAGIVRPFAAEDGSDRRCWLSPHERGDPRDLPSSEHELRDALAAWDFRDPEGWRSAPGNVAEMLGRFATSEVFRELSRANRCLRDVEFQLNLAESDSELSAVPQLRGMIDCLWLDAKGDWHLFGWALTVDPALEEQWETRRPGLVIQSRAVEVSVGVGPKSIGLYSFPEGRAMACTRRQFRQKQVLTAARAALSSLPGRPLSPG